ncbi:MAG: PQQ-binding-like beta-propeller repeat protein [Chthoniobacteraceae bacterium]
MKYAIVFVALLAVCAWSAEAEWPQFRGPTGQGISAATGVPVKWSATENVAWSVEVPGRGWSSPVFSNGRLYLTSAVDDGGVITLRALCFDAVDGRTLWDTTVFTPEPGPATKMHRKNSAASPTPIVTEDRLYVHFGHMGTAALDLSGKVVWRQTELAYPPVHGTGGSPILAEGALVFSCDGQSDPFVVALDAATGAVRWKAPRNSPAMKQFSFSTPLAVKRGGVTQIISPGSGLVGAYDLKDGRELWRVAYGEGYSVVPRPVFAHDLLFVSSSFDKPTLYAVRPDGTDVAWTIPKGAPHTASTIVVGDEIYFVSDGGIATCADARTGDVHWTERVGGNFSASPIAAEGRIYFQNETGIGTVIAAGRKFEVLATNDLAEPTLASPAVADGAIFIRSEKRLRRIGR